MRKTTTLALTLCALVLGCKQDSAGEASGKKAASTKSVEGEPGEPEAPAQVQPKAKEPEPKEVTAKQPTADGCCEELEASKAALAALKEENKQLKQTAHFAFQGAISLTGSNSDEGDAKAIEAFQVVIDRFPTDPLASVAKTKTAELNKAIKQRAAALMATQAKVRKLIKTCQAQTAKEIRISRDSLVFNSNNQINMNRAMAGERRAEKHRRAAEKAKEKAEELLKSVPDPDGRLAEALEKCNESDD